MKTSIKALKLLIILIPGVLALAIIPAICADDVTISLGRIAADQEGICKAPVVLSSITNYGTGAITIKYDPSIVHITDVKSSEDSTVVAWNADNDKGEAKIAAWKINSVSGDIDFATITFCESYRSGSSPLIISVDELVIQDEEGVQKNIDARVINGTFTTGASSSPGFEVLTVLIILGVFYRYRKLQSNR